MKPLFLISIGLITVFVLLIGAVYLYARSAVTPPVTLNALFTDENGYLCDRACLLGVRLNMTVDEAQGVLKRHPLTRALTFRFEPYQQVLTVHASSILIRLNFTSKGGLFSMSISRDYANPRAMHYTAGQDLSGEDDLSKLLCTSTSGDFVALLGIPDSVTINEADGSAYTTFARSQLNLRTYNPTAITILERAGLRNPVRLAPTDQFILVLVQSPIVARGKQWIGFASINRYLGP